ncbi:MAG: aspartate--tRNA ligase, partial [Rhodospirillales bacterium]|nr:aspartate--tRNA ligase [Rhodospirillales bacterium]
MHPYRTHTCGDIRPEHIGETVRLSGWINRQRDHGNLLFIDLRDHYGLTQCVIDSSADTFKAVEAARLEFVVSIVGKVVARSDETINAKLPTGHVEVAIEQFEILSEADALPLQVNSDNDYGEDTRLTYRFLDLRREKMQRNMILRSDIISSIRSRLTGSGFREYQTPILTASSPEGARDYLVPSRVHP